MNTGLPSPNPCTPQNQAAEGMLVLTAGAQHPITVVVAGEVSEKAVVSPAPNLGLGRTVGRMVVTLAQGVQGVVLTTAVVTQLLNRVVQLESGMQTQLLSY